jgi:hypothetical protein
VNTSYGKNRDSEHPRQSIENRALWLPRPWAVDASKPFKVSQRTSCSVAFLDTLCGRESHLFMRSYEGAAFFVDKYHNEILKVTLKVTIFQQNETPCLFQRSPL